MPQDHQLLMDVGGSYIKYGCANIKGELLPQSVKQTEANASGSAEEIFGAVRKIIRSARQSYPIAGACVSMPGPFDFDSGTSHMKHKYPALYGLSLRTPFEEEGIPVSFLHDSTAFILGEFHAGVLKGAQSPCCVMLGTGLGFAWIRSGFVMVDDNQTPAMPLWRCPYRKGIAEDYVSARAIRELYGDVPVEEIARCARDGDAKARNAFAVTAEHLSAILTPLLQRLSCDRFALGGQIAKAADLMPLELPVPWKVSPHPDETALLGAAWYSSQGRNACVRIIPRLQFDEKRVFV